MKEDLIVLLVCCLMILALVGGVFGLNYFGQYQRCQEKWEGFSPSYSYWGGCKIVKDGRTIPADMIREVE